MKVNVNSWHYRYMINLLEFERPNNLCAYFWKLLLCIVFSPIFGIMGLFVVTVCAVAWPFVWLKEKYEAENMYKTRKPNIAISYLKAKKQKACPLIEYVDE